MGIKSRIIEDSVIAQMVLDAGFVNESAIIAFCVIIAESNGDAWAINMNTHDPTSVSYLSLDKGIAQWNDYWWPDIASGPNAFDPIKSINKMYAESEGGTDFRLWNAYKNHTFVRHVARAYEAFGW